MKHLTTQDKMEILKQARLAGGYDGFTSPPSDWDIGDFVFSPQDLIRFVQTMINHTINDVDKAIWDQSDDNDCSPEFLNKVSEILSDFQRS